MATEPISVLNVEREYLPKVRGPVKGLAVFTNAQKLQKCPVLKSRNFGEKGLKKFRKITSEKL